MSGREWQPGDVALATVHGIPNVRVFRYQAHDLMAMWDTGTRIREAISHQDEDVTNARPLVVIDPEDMVQVARLAQLMMSHGCRAETDLQSALRAWVAPPPKPPEPTGLGAVVEDADGERWVRCDTHERLCWHGPSDFARHWNQLPAVKVLHPGWSE